MYVILKCFIPFGFQGDRGSDGSAGADGNAGRKVDEIHLVIRKCVNVAYAYAFIRSPGTALRTCACKISYVNVQLCYSKRL